MGLDATKPLAADAMRFTRIRVPGEEAVDLAKPVTGGNWRKALAE
jgi:hypothetical protein